MTKDNSLNKNKCVHCGNNPVPHLFTKFDSFMAISVVHFGTVFFSLAIGRWSASFVNKFLVLFSKLFFLIGLLRFNNDPKNILNRRGQVLWEEANKCGIKMQNFRFLNKNLDLYRAKINLPDGKGSKTLYFDGLPRVGEDHASLVWMDDKGILKEKLEKEEVPVARGGSFSDFEKMQEKFLKIDKPVIIKPRLGSRGRHTTTFIYNEKDLRKAYDIAKQLCYSVIMEEHIEGSVYRGTVIDGKLAGVLGGDPPRITGDGKHSISELIKIKNENKLAGVSDFIIKEGTPEFLKRQGYDLQTVLQNSKVVDLTEKIGVLYGGLSINVTDITHPEIKKMLEHAGRVVNDPILGFDFIIKDIAGDPKEQKWGIIECNAVPFINLHHDPLVGKSINVAGKIWDYVEREIK